MTLINYVFVGAFTTLGLISLVRGEYAGAAAMMLIAYLSLELEMNRRTITRLRKGDD